MNRIILGSVTFCLACSGLAFDGRVTPSIGKRTLAKRVAPARLKQIAGEWVPVQIGPWTPVQNGANTAVSTDSAFDLFEYGFDTDGAVLPDENGAYGATCGLGDTAIRWTYAVQTRATMIYNDMNVVPGQAGTKGKRVAFAWTQGVTEGLQVAVFATENWGAAVPDPNNSVQRGDLTGALIDFGTDIADPVGFYQWADVDITAAPVQLPLDGSGGYILQYRTANNTAFSTLTSPAFWGTKSGNLGKSLDAIEYQSTTTNNGTFTLPGDAKNFALALCPDPLGSMVLFLNTAPSIIVPAAQTLNLGQQTAGNLASLAADDSNAAVFCKAFLPTFTSPYLRLEVTATSLVSSPSFFRFEAKMKSNSAGTFQQTLYLFDYIANAYTTNRVDTINLTYATRQLYGTGTLSNYVRTGDNQIKSRLEVRRTGFSAVLVPCASIEYAQWGVAP